MPTAYVLFGVGLIVSLQTWLVMRSFDQQREHDLLKQAFEFYVENAGKGAAVILNRPNPVPLDIQPLLRAHIRGELKDPDERQKLLDWARSVALNPEFPRDERGVAFALVAAVGSVKRLRSQNQKSWWKIW